MPFRSSVLITVLLGQPAFAVTTPTDFFTQLSDWSGSSVMAGHGADVAVDGHLAVVGRPGDAHDGPQSGAVDVYMRTATEASLEGMPWQWTHVSTVRPEMPEAGARFGDAVAIDDGILVVGAWRYGDDHGGVWVVDLTDDVLPSSIRTDLMLEAPGIHPGDYLGCDVAIDDGLIVAGAWGADLDASEDDDVEVTTVGQAWTWTIAEIEGSFTPSTVLMSHAPQAGARFGTAVDIENGYVIVGAPRHNGSQGMVEFFEWYDGQWQFQQSLTSEMPHAWARYGAAVDLVPISQGLALLVGSPGDNELGSQAGAAWLYDPIESGGSFMDGTKLTMGGGQSWDQAGSSVVGLDITVNGDEQASRGLILLGAPGWRDPNGLVQGAIMSFSGGDGESDLDWPEQQIVAFGDPHSAAGHSVAIGMAVVQEWDTDVISVWTGAPMSSNGQGRAFNLDVIANDRNGDCNEDFRFDLMEVLLLGAEVDCDGDGWHDACQVEFEGLLYDCDANGNLDSCEMATDPSLDCNADGELDVCQLDAQWYNYDCDGNGLIDTCEFDEDPALDCNGDGVLDVCQAYDPALDCDENGLVDSCEFGDDPTLDCNGDGVLDVCQAFGPGLDCDENGLIDSCELEADPSLDCDEDGFLDACQEYNSALDCDSNGLIDSCELDNDPTLDCDVDGVLDVCQGFNAGLDCDANGLIDSCEIEDDPALDCNGDGVLDVCQAYDPAIDCDENGLVDSCELGDDPTLDCNGDGVLDACQAFGPGLDCDENGLIDSCELEADPSLDCDGNGFLDACQAYDPALDCDLNGLIDSCEIAVDPLLDCDADGLLDWCQVLVDPLLDCDNDGVIDTCGFADAVDLMSEYFVQDLDLGGLGGRWVPPVDASSAWGYCTISGTGAWIDPTNHKVLSMEDDDSVEYPIPFSFPFAGQWWDNIRIGSNGYITFDTFDTNYIPSLSAHFSMMRISALFADLDPSVSGDVRVGVGPANSVVVTWMDLPLYDQPTRLNRVQLVLHPDGAFETTWDLVDVDDAVVGVSVGLGVPPFFRETDLSDALNCDPQAATPFADCNENDVADQCELTIPGEPRWGVEHYSLDCDLINKQVRWVGQGGSPYWSVCSTPVSEFQIDPLGGTILELQDETSLLVDIGFSFPFAGDTFNEMYVSDNGYVTFGTAGGGYEALPVDHFMIPGIAAYRTDLDPSSGGQVLLGTGPGGSTAVTWLDVPMYSGAGASSSDLVSVQLVLHPDGAFEAIWLEVPVVTAIVGPSDGLGIPANFAQTDLSAAGDICQSVHAWDDCDVSGVHDGIEIGLGCLTDLGGGVVQECGYFYFGDADGPMPSCICDITEDQQVDVMDLIAVLHAWGPLKIGDRFSRADVAPAKRDLHVGLPDLLAVIDSMGETCYQP